jgi:hypothetical protein
MRRRRGADRFYSMDNKKTEKVKRVEIVGATC